ncbi:MAG: LptF/LptG family permease [Planctomycetes bacterium]|nr:LptF/LptG family permease [Planctomycetota bacterium]
MRLLDRYLAKTFAAAAAVFLVTFVALSLVIDFATKAERFLAVKSTSVPVFIARYYSLRAPVYLHLILPMVPVFAASFTLVRMAKNNEILPILTSGTSLRRTVLPAVAAAALLGAADAAIEEKLLPALSDDLGKTDELLLSGRIDIKVAGYGPDGTHAVMESYDRALRRMSHVRLTKIGAEGRREFVIVAERGDWIEEKQSWILFEGYAEPYDERGAPLLVPSADGRFVARRDPIGPEGLLLRSDFTPKCVYDGFRFLNDFARLEDLREQMRRFPAYRPTQVTYHSRLSFPFAGLVLMLLGLPAVSATRSRSFFLGIALCLLLVIAFYGFHLACLELGYKGRLTPAVAAWTSIAVFGPAGAAAFWRMKT